LAVKNCQKNFFVGKFLPKNLKFGAENIFVLVWGCEIAVSRKIGDNNSYVIIIGQNANGNNCMVFNCKCVLLAYLLTYLLA